MRGSRILIVPLLFVALMAAQEQPAYQPKFKGDPAHSEAEAGAMGYMRTVLAAEKIFKKANGRYANSLDELVHKGSFTKRMLRKDRGEYTVGYRSERKGEDFQLTLTPKQFDAAHRAFFADSTGTIRAESDKGATKQSPPAKAE